MLWGGVKGISSGPYIVCRNYTADTTEYNKSPGAFKGIFNAYAAKEQNIKKTSSIASWVSFFIPFFLYIKLHPIIFLLDLSVFVTSISMTIYYRSAIKRLSKTFVAEFRAAIQKLLDDPAYIKSIS
ncbi:hypothetical protein [Novacetimonas maltaceti]|uniref:hypothetical protein n=1 Tax=Novacetimonas maltaceti TaxID=1203393 RepID=UPI0011AF7C5F|nr:hypothetical protein [Novacetimonas maltaceti]